MMTAPIQEIAPLQARVLAEAAAFERMGQIARRNVWFNTVLMVAWIVSAFLLCSTVFWSVFFCAVAASHGLAAVVWEEADPRTWARHAAIELRHHDQLRDEAMSWTVIERMRSAELMRTHPWRTWVCTSALFGAPIVATYLAMRARGWRSSSTIQSGLTKTPPLGSLTGISIINR